jgi:hypothetical protein
MTLYVADVMDIAKPVSKKSKKLPVTPPPSEVEVPTQNEKPVKEKKPMTEKQRAALEKAKAARLAKKQEAESQQQQQQEQEAAALAKKEAAKEKRRQARLKRKADQSLDKEIDTAVQQVQSERPQTTSEVEVPQAPPAKVKKSRKPRNPADPPTWFSKYIEGVKREQSVGEKKPVRQIQQEAHAEAKTKWDDGMVRDRLQNEVDSHMNRMYSMIFGR